MGGIASDDRGRSSLPGLWCVGECASTGLHGANRLASNSLVEALVFGARIAEDIRGGIRPALANGKTPGPARFETAATPNMLRQAMTRGVGLERDETGLKSALATISNIERAAGSDTSMLNVIAAAKLIAAGALVRRESIGAHFRRDFPLAGEVRQRSLLTLAEADRIVREIPSPDSELRSRLQ
jgi:L-aspartate oxidase